MIHCELSSLMYFFYQSVLMLSDFNLLGSKRTELMFTLSCLDLASLINFSSKKQILRLTSSASFWTNIYCVYCYIIKHQKCLRRSTITQLPKNQYYSGCSCGTLHCNFQLSDVLNSDYPCQRKIGEQTAINKE